MARSFAQLPNDPARRGGNGPAVTVSMGPQPFDDRSDMVKVFALIPRRPDVTTEFFHEHWAGPHADLALRITTMRRYVQSHRTTNSVAGLGESIYEGIAEVWFDDAATAAGMGEDPNYAEGAHLDEPNFIDTDNLGFLLSDEDVQLAGEPVGKEAGGAKVMLLLRRADGMDPADFGRRLREVRVAELVPDVLRATVSVAIPEMYADGAEPTFDAVVEARFADASTFETAWSQAGDGVLSAIDAFADRDRSAGFVAQELRVIWPEDVPATV